MSQFQRNSAFSQPLTPKSPRKGITLPAVQATKAEGPDRAQLERWYDILVDLLDRESDGDMDHTTELTDLRDEIYAYLY